MATQDEFLPETDARTQLNLRAGEADDEVRALIPPGIELFESVLGHAVVDKEVGGYLNPPKRECPIYIPLAKVNGVVLNSVGVASIRAQIDDGTTGSHIGNLLNGLEGNEDLEEYADVQAMRSATAGAFTVGELNEIVIELGSIYTATGIAQVSPSVTSMLSTLAGMARQSGIVRRFNRRTGYTKVDEPDADWADALADSQSQVPFRAYVGTPIVDVPGRWKQAVKLCVAWLYNTRGGLTEDPKPVVPLVSSLIGVDRVTPALGDALNHAPPQV